MKNIKYMAGFLDADGSYGLSSFKNADGTYTIYPYVSAAQAVYQDEMLRILAKDFKVQGHVKTFDNPNWSDTFNLHIGGKKGLRLMEHVKNHAVIKRDVIEFCLSQAGNRVSKEELKDIKKLLKKIRKAPQTKVRPFPSRRWLAGYFDGDGCISTSMLKDGTLITFITITCWKPDSQAVELIMKQFGGSIQDSGSCVKYRVNITETSSHKILGYFGKHTIAKKRQIDAVLAYVGKGKHLKRRGATTEDNTLFKKKLSAMKRGRID